MSATTSTWRPSKIKFLAQYINGFPFKPVDWSDRGRPIIRIQNLSNPDADPNYFEGEIPEVYLVKDGDLLLSWSASLGAYEWSGPDAWLNQHIFKVALDEKQVSKKYYRWLAAWFMRELSSEVHGSTMQHLTKDRFGGFKVNIPPVPLQEAISNFLDRETTRIDELIAEKERMLALLDEKRSALISRVVTRGLDPNVSLKPSGQEWLGKIPAHWGLQRLKQLAEVRGGLTLGKQYFGALVQYPYLRVANVQDGYLNLDDVLTIDVPASEARSNLLAYGDVLMNEGGDIDKLGRGCVWREEIAPCLHQNHVFAVRPHSVEANWLALWTSTLQAKRYFESRAKRSTNLASISGWNVKELPIPLPPIAEQLAIRQFLADQHSRHELLCNELRGSLRLLTERRAALITASVTGQIPLEVMDR